MKNDLAQLILWLLVDIKTLWDEQGFGDDYTVSEPLYDRLKAAIKLLNEAAISG